MKQKTCWAAGGAHGTAPGPARRQRLIPRSLQVGGAAVLAVGVWTLVEKSGYLSVLASSTFAASAYILIFAGALVMVTGFLGFSAIVREDRSCLSTVSAAGPGRGWRVGSRSPSPPSLCPQPAPARRIPPVMVALLGVGGLGMAGGDGCPWVGCLPSSPGSWELSQEGSRSWPSCCFQILSDWFSKLGQVKKCL